MRTPEEIEEYCKLNNIQYSLWTPVEGDKKVLIDLKDLTSMGEEIKEAFFKYIKVK